MRTRFSIARAVHVVGLAHSVSMMHASDITVSAQGGDGAVDGNLTYYLLKGQAANAQGAIQLRGTQGNGGANRGHLKKMGNGKKGNAKKGNGKEGNAKKANAKMANAKKANAKMAKAKNAKANKAKANKANEKQGKALKNQTPNQQPAPSPSALDRPSPNLPARASCFSVDTYDSIDYDIAMIKNNVRSEQERSHFLGGIVRMAAHDFMDYDRHDRNYPMGADGCYDRDHLSNVGLETIWCRGCPLRTLYQDKYSHISRADFWIASANAVIRQTSIGNSLDLRDTFVWGRKDNDVCHNSGLRLPQSSSCDEVEDVFLERMGLTWTDAVALLGAHTLGRGSGEFSGHEGSWSSSDIEAQVFDKKYYEALFTEAWRPRNMGGDTQDWTTGNGHDRMMLNTDICLVFDIKDYVEQNVPCCTRTNNHYSNGQDECVDMEAAARRCPMYASHDRRRDATGAVREMLGGSLISKNNAPFYINFARAWKKATTLGLNNLSPLNSSCEVV